MFLVELNLNLKSSLYCTAVILCFCLLLWLKHKIFKDTKQKKTMIWNILFNLIIFAGFLVGMAFATNLDFSQFGTTFTTFINDSIERIVNSALLIICCILIYNFVSLFIKSSASRKNKNPKRVSTVSKIALSLLKYLLFIVGAIIFLSIWGINVVPALAGLGISALVLGLGAQDLIKDFVAGLFIIFEHHFDVGDIVSINDFKGEVIDMGLKTTKVKNWAGDIKIISNGNIGDLINYSLTDTVFSIDIDISYDEDIDHAIEVLNKEMPLRMIHCKDLLVAPKAAGVSELADSGVRIRIFATTPAEKQYAVSRDLLKVCKQILDDYKIEIPYNHLVVETVKSDSHD